MGSEQFLALERERVQRRVAADDRLRMSRDEREEKLAGLRALLRRTMAHAEIVYRGHENGERILPRAHVDGEMYLADDTTLRELEAG